MQEKQGDAEERCEERSGMVEGGEEVICEVVDLYYGIEVPQVLPSSARGFWSWASTTAAAEADAAAAAAKPMTKKRVLLNGVNCRICAGDMVAVIVSLRVCAISLPSIVPSFFSAINTQSGASEQWSLDPPTFADLSGGGCFAGLFWTASVWLGTRNKVSKPRRTAVLFRFLDSFLSSVKLQPCHSLRSHLVPKVPNLSYSCSKTRDTLCRTRENSVGMHFPILQSIGWANVNVHRGGTSYS